MSIQVSLKISLFNVYNFQDWASWTSSSNKNPSNWDLPDASDFNREPDMDKYKPPQLSQAIQNNPTWNKPIKG